MQSVSVRTGNPAGVLRALRPYAGQADSDLFGTLVPREDGQGAEAPTSPLTVRVPQGELDRLLAELARLGTVTRGQPPASASGPATLGRDEAPATASAGEMPRVWLRVTIVPVPDAEPATPADARKTE